MTPRIVPTPLTAAALGDLAAARGAQAGRRFPREAEGALLSAGKADANRQRLLAGGCLAVTTGQQAGLFTGPMLTIHKALSAAALAAELVAAHGTPVVPVFWVPGDDHDFAEINHCVVLAADSSVRTVVLRERPADAPMLPAYRELVGADGARALAELEAALVPGNPSVAARQWLADAYQPECSLAEAYARALAELLAPYGVVVCRGWHASLKQAAKAVMLGALEHAGAIDAALTAAAAAMRADGRDTPIDVGDGLSLVMIEASQGRDRLKIAGPRAFVTRRSGESFTLEVLAREPERLSANVLLRSVVEAAVLPTVAYMAGPGELAYLAQTGPVFTQLEVPQPAYVPRFSAMLVDPKVDKVLEKYHLAPAALGLPEGELASTVARDALPVGVLRPFEELRAALEAGYARVAEEAIRIDPTLQRTVEGARNQALGGSQELEKKLVAAFKRSNDTMLQQVMRARAQLFPGGKPQERVLTVAGFLARYGAGVLDGLYDAARAHARGYLETPPRRS